MYLRQSNRWNEFLLAEAIENIGLPPRVVSYLRTRANFTITGDAWAKGAAQKRQVELTPIDDKMLTWLGLLVKKHPMPLFNRDHAREVADFIKKEVQRAYPEPSEERGERMIDAIGPLLDVPGSGTPEYETQTLADIKGLRKRIQRAVMKAGLSEDFAKKVGTIFDHRVVNKIKDNDAFRLLVRHTLITLAVDPYLYEEGLKQIDTLQGAGQAAKEFLENPAKEQEKVIHEFPNGYFWYDLQSSHCDYEAKQMGHCGRTDKGTLISLRSGAGRKMKPLVTLEFDGKVLYQIKGKANQPPKEDLWPYIEWFVENMGVESIKEAPSEMMSHLKEKYPDLDWGDRWASHADELLDQYEAGIETDEQTDVELDYAAEGDDEEVGVVLTHQAYWPILDKVVEEDTDKLVSEITQDAKSLADDTLYPNPSHVRAAVFRRGEQDSRTAMLRIEMWWSKSFKEPDPGNEYDAAYEEAVTKQLENLHEFLEEMEEISGYLVSTESAPEDAEFDYNGFWEGIEKRLQEYGVFRDVAGEIDAEDERDRDGQMELPLQEGKRQEPDWFSRTALLRERRIIQRWQQIIK